MMFVGAILIWINLIQRIHPTADVLSYYYGWPVEYYLWPSDPIHGAGFVIWGGLLTDLCTGLVILCTIAVALEFSIRRRARKRQEPSRE